MYGASHPIDVVRARSGSDKGAGSGQEEVEEEDYVVVKCTPLVTIPPLLINIRHIGRPLL